MSNSIKITKCDNELYILAVATGTNADPNNLSNQLCHIQSGGNQVVDVTINIEEGNYVQPATLNGVFHPLYINSQVKLPKGDYNILAVGIDWGGGRDIEGKINNGESFGTNGYTPGHEIGVYQVNDGRVLGKIAVN